MKEVPTASNSFPNAEIVRVELLVPESTEVGRRATLLCSISEGVNPIFSWLKDGKPLEPSKRIRFYNSDVSCTLSIKRVEMSDAGEYVCIVGNEFSEDRIGAKLSVRGEL